MNMTRRTAYDAALDVLKRLRDAGHVSLFAGGCVRDRLLQHTPKDYDVATSARPDEVLDLYPRARCVGAKFGVVLVRRFGHDIEVATFRTDGCYSDGRRPEEVAFCSAQEDAMRRDFTINGLFFDPLEQRVIDYVGGQKDLDEGIVRTIGAPDKRFEEDHLRMLRAIRFAARLSFTIHPETMAAVCRQADRLERISPERIWMELSAILTSPGRSVGWRLLLESGLRNVLTPHWPSDPDQEALTGERLAALPAVPLPPPLVFAACNPHPVVAVCRSLRLSNRLTERVQWLVERLGDLRGGRSPELWELKQLMAHVDWQNLLHLLEADLCTTGGDLQVCRQLERRARAIPPEAVSPEPLVTGDDLMAMGAVPGPEFGRILDALYRDQLDEKIVSRKDALTIARQRLRE